MHKIWIKVNMFNKTISDGKIHQISLIYDHTNHLPSNKSYNKKVLSLRECIVYKQLVMGFLNKTMKIGNL